MNERQRDLFLWLWSQRRRRGSARVARLGALVGAGGGLLFSSVLLAGMCAPTGSGATGLSAILPWFERAMTLLVMTVPALAGVGYFNAWRAYRQHEQLYQSMLLAGARVPAQAPSMTLRERGPMIAVVATAVVLACLVLGLVGAVASGRL